MRSMVFTLEAFMHLRHQIVRSLTLAVVLALPFLSGIAAQAQQPDAAKDEIHQLRSELQRISDRLATLEAARDANALNTAAQAPAAPAESAHPTEAATSQAPSHDMAMDSMDAGMGGETVKVPLIPAMKLRGFGDVRATIANANLAVVNANDPGQSTAAYQGGNSTFGLGLTDLFVTSKITETFSFLAEIGFEAGTLDNGVGVDLERAQLSWMPSRHFSLSAGRTHAMMGYCNTAFHHGTWFQTTIDRPHIFEFEDSGGPLPIHNVGLSVMGSFPGRASQLHWFAEVGNGKQTYSIGASVTPANVLADHTGKSTNVGLYLRPDRLSGLQIGANWYHASTVPVLATYPGYGNSNFPFPHGAGYYAQNIVIGHIVYTSAKTEFLAEDAAVRDLARGTTKPIYTSGGYAQVSHLFHNQYRPYFRYQWLNPNFSDPNTAYVGRWVGPNGGVRIDLNTFIALKFEASHFDWRGFTTDSSGIQGLPLLHKSLNTLGSQLTYTF